MPDSRVMWSWIRQRKKRVAIGLLAVVVLGANVGAFLHARAMTHFVEEGQRTPRIEQLGFWGKVRVLAFGVNIPRPANRLDPSNYALPFEAVQVQTPDGVLAVWDIPVHNAKGLVLMFHGYAASKDQLLPEARVFHEMGYRVWLVDFRGSGGSFGNTTTIGFYEANDVAAVFSQASKGFAGPLYLYGKSMGASAVLRACGSLGVVPQALMVECPFNSLHGTIANRFRAMGLPAFPAAHLLTFWGGLQHGFNGFAFNPQANAANIKSPALYMQGSTDPRVTPTQAKALYNHHAGPKKQVVFEGVGHVSYLGAKPQLWKTEIRSFLAKSKERE